MTHQDCWSTQGPSDKSASHPGELLDTAGARNGPRVARDNWSTPRGCRLGREWSMTAGRPRGPSDPSSSPPGDLVNPTGPQIRARDARESWSTPRELGLGPKAPRTDGPPRQPSDTGPSCPGQLVDTPGPQSRTRITGKAGRTCGPSDPRPSRPGEMVDSAGPQIQARVAGTAGGLRGDSEQGLSRPGELFDTAGGRTRARVFRESWSSPRELGAEPRSPGAFGRSRTTWDTFLSHPRQLVDSACFGPGPETPGTAGRHRGPSEPGASRRGGLVNFSGHWTRA